MPTATGGRHGGGWRHGRLDADLAFVAAYATTLSGVLVSGGLTYAYVGPGVRELNPVTAGLITGIGPGGTVAARFLVVVATFWGYHFLRDRWPILTVAFAWIGALVHLLDAVHDLRVAATAAALGFVPAVDVGGCLVVLTAGTLAGVLLRPPASPGMSGDGGGVARLTLARPDEGEKASDGTNSHG